MEDNKSYIKQVSDGIEDHRGKDIVEIDIFVEVSKDTDVNTLPFNAITRLMQRLAREASEALIEIFKQIKDDSDGDTGHRSKGISPNS